MFQHPSPPPVALPAAGGSRVQPTTVSIRFLLYLPWSDRAPQKPRLPRRRSPNRLLPGARYKGLTRSSPRARPRPSLPRLALRHPRQRRSLQTASPLGRAGVQQQRLVRHPPLSNMASGQAGALSDAAELRFADSVARYSHADWKQEQHAEPTCHPTMRYISIGRPSTLPPDVLACYHSHKLPPISDIQELAGNGQLHTTDDDIVLLIRNPTLPPSRYDEPNSVGRAACLLNDEPARIYVPLFMRPWIMQDGHSTASCLFGTMRTLRMLERFYWWIGMMNVCTQW